MKAFIQLIFIYIYIFLIIYIYTVYYYCMYSVCIQMRLVNTFYIYRYLMQICIPGRQGWFIYSYISLYIYRYTVSIHIQCVYIYIVCYIQMNTKCMKMLYRCLMARPAYQQVLFTQCSNGQDDRLTNPSCIYINVHESYISVNTIATVLFYFLSVPFVLFLSFSSRSPHCSMCSAHCFKTILYNNEERLDRKTWAPSREVCEWRPLTPWLV